MKQKSLRQLAKELGVSHSYLSQVRNGKRPPSEKVVSKSGKQVVSIFAPEPSLTETGYVVSHTRKCYNQCRTGESSRGRTADSESVSEGSTPSFLVKFYIPYNYAVFSSATMDTGRIPE